MDLLPFVSQHSRGGHEFNFRLVTSLFRRLCVCTRADLYLCDLINSRSIVLVFVIGVSRIDIVRHRGGQTREGVRPVVI